MPMRIGAAIGEEGRRIGQGLWSGATLPGDVATGKASMADPETQQRVGSMAGLVTLGAGAMPAEAGALNMGARNLNPMGLYSHGADIAANLPQKVGTTQQMTAALQKQGVKPVEMSGAGLTGEGLPSTITRDELAQRFEQASPPLQETVLQAPTKEARLHELHGLGDNRTLQQQNEMEDILEGNWTGRPSTTSGEPKFDQYTLPGRQNYREVLMHLPSD